MLRSTPGTDNTQNTLKRLGVNHIPGIEEVNFFRDDGSVIHFKNPKSVQASIGANTYVIRSSPVRGPCVCALHVCCSRFIPFCALALAGSELQPLTFSMISILRAVIV
jgi:hypothetical protein